LIDPYLSDFLAEKYQGAEFPHLRMMQAPIEPPDLLTWTGCSAPIGILITWIQVRSPIWRNQIQDADSLYLALSWLPLPRRCSARTDVGVNAGETLQLSPHLTLRVVASAHETFKVNEQGGITFSDTSSGPAASIFIIRVIASPIAA